MVMAKCVVCAAEFESKKGKNTCGSVCYKLRYNERHYKWAKENPEKVRECKREYQARVSKKVIAKCVICDKELEKKTSNVTCGEVCRVLREQEYRRKWYAKNCEHICKRRKENPELALKEDKERRLKYKEQINKRARLRYQENPELGRKRSEMWKKENREHVNEYQREYIKFSAYRKKLQRRLSEYINNAGQSDSDIFHDKVG